MTNKQITSLLSKLNEEYSDSGILYGEDIWMTMDEVSAMIFSTDEYIYPDKDCQVMFDSETQTIRTRHGKIIDGEFKIILEPSLIYDYEGLTTIIMVDRTHTKSPYRRGAAL